jgi:protein phosphatase
MVTGIDKGAAWNQSNQPGTQRSHGAMIGYPAHLHWTSVALSNTGLVRSHNEDSFLDQPERGLWAVADGMGGHARGDLASSMVVDALNQLQPASSLSESIAAARDCLLAVNGKLRAEAYSQNVSIIGSTVVALIAHDQQCACLWAGDSRIYLCRDHNLQQLTRDHSQIEELKSMGHLTPDMLANLPSRNLITRAVGAHEMLEIDHETIEVHDGDMFLLCSDGLSNEVTDDEMCNALASGNCRLAAEALMNLALMRGGRDNISIVVVRAEDLGTSEKTAFNPMV